MTQIINVLMWKDGRIFAIKDNEIGDDMMMSYSCPYQDIEDAELVEIKVNIPA